jgi:ABC-2 type transport system ATP-binding protein
MIEIKDLQKVIDQKTVISIQSLKVKAGEIAAVVGPVDNGQDTFLELLTGKSLPTMGTIRLGGIDPIADRDQFSRQVGVLFSDDSLYKRQSPRSNLEFYRRLHKLHKKRVKEVLAKVGLADHASTTVNKLSSSLVRRLTFGRAILHKPDVLLLVEPFLKCDDTSVALLSSLIRQQAEDGTAVLIFANEDNNLTNLCTNIHLLNQGRIVRSYQPHEEQQGAMPFKIPVRMEGKVALVNPSDILYADAAEGRAYLQTTEERFPTQFTLGELEGRLSRSGFFRAHRGYLVNLQHIKEVIPYTRNSFSLLLDDEIKTEIPLSKSAAAELKELLGF